MFLLKANLLSSTLPHIECCQLRLLKTTANEIACALED